MADGPAANAPTLDSPAALEQSAALEAAAQPPAPAKGAFDDSLIFQQSDPTNDPPETAGVQTASIAPGDRTSILVSIGPPLNQMISTLVAIVPSTGGPSIAVLATALLALGGVGLWLRRSGRIRG